MRIAYAAVTAMVLMPANAVTGGFWIGVAGLLLAVVAIVYESTRSDSQPR